MIPARAKYVMRPRNEDIPGQMVERLTITQNPMIECVSQFRFGNTNAEVPIAANNSRSKAEISIWSLSFHLIYRYYYYFFLLVYPSVAVHIHTHFHTTFAYLSPPRLDFHHFPYGSPIHESFVLHLEPHTDNRYPTQHTHLQEKQRAKKQPSTENLFLSDRKTKQAPKSNLWPTWPKYKTKYRCAIDTIMIFNLFGMLSIHPNKCVCWLHHPRPSTMNVKMSWWRKTTAAVAEVLQTCRPADLKSVGGEKESERAKEREREREEKVLRKCNLDRVQYNSWISFIRLEPYGWQSTMFHFVSVRFYADGPNVLVRECVHQVVFPSHLDF